MDAPSPPVAQALLERLGLRQLIGQSPEFLAEVYRIPKVAKFDVSVLITGETGTGKELFARAIHYLSSRSGRPFIGVNCGAIPTDLIENELFGHDQGAFTHAVAARSGLVEEAEGGTLFLDELDCLPLLAQVKLLRFLQEKEYRPLGSTRVRKADVRVIAATNADTKGAIADGRLRGDLFHRLSVMQFFLPPLKQRSGDIDLLARHFLTKYAEHFNKPMTGFSEPAMEILLRYHWPGNVRELENTVERAVILADDQVIDVDDILIPGQPPVAEPRGSFREIKARVIADFEKSYIRSLLTLHRGNVTLAAREAKKDRRAFLKLMRKHGITRTV